ncbi:hypothetical protein YC2023_082034 [Brassica napus]
MAPLALFRPNVDEISLLSIDTSNGVSEGSAAESVLEELWMRIMQRSIFFCVSESERDGLRSQQKSAKLVEAKLIATSKFMWRFQGQTRTSSHLTLGTTLTIRGSTRLPPSMQML